MQDLCDDSKTSEQSEAENVITVQDSFDSYDQSISSPMESAQECWSSGPTCHDALKQRSNEDDTEAQSDTKPFGSLKNDNSSLKQSELGGEAQSDTESSGSLESDDASLKQNRLEASEPTAEKKQHSVLDSMSKLVRKVTPSKQKRKDEQNPDVGGSSVKSKLF